MTSLELRKKIIVSFENLRKKKTSEFPLSIGFSEVFSIIPTPYLPYFLPYLWYKSYGFKAIFYILSTHYFIYLIFSIKICITYSKRIVPSGLQLIIYIIVLVELEELHFEIDS